jgi:hypothetical protein
MKTSTLLLFAPLSLLVPTALVLPACSNALANCEADCDARGARCPLDDVNCAALCDTYVGLGDSGGCGDERLVYQGCVIDAACSTGCDAELRSLNECVSANSSAPCLRHCRDRDAAGCGDASCDDVCLLTEYVGRATDCETEVNRWTACLVDGPQCDAGTRCLSLFLDATSCRNAYCTANPEEPACD